MSSVSDISATIQKQCDIYIPTDISQYLREISPDDSIEFIIHNSRTYTVQAYIQRLMLSAFPLWKTFTIDDWKAVMKGTADCELAFFWGLSSFMYQYLDIDIYPLLDEIDGIHPDVRKNIDSLYRQWKGVLSKDVAYVRDLRPYEEYYQGIHSLREELYRQGAPRAVPIVLERIKITEPVPLPENGKQSGAAA